MRIHIAAIAFVFGTALADADTIKTTSGHVFEGVVIKETDARVLIKLKHGTVGLAKSEIASIEKSKPAANDLTPTRLATWDKCVDIAAHQSWATDLEQIPATVIDTGVLKNVPYSSFKSAEYEFNIYGDPDDPACLEIGVHKPLTRSNSAKKNCLEFMASLLGEPEDQQFLKTLDLAKDDKTREGLTFEVTPETAEDAYGGWWISVYDEKVLDKVRATAKELKEITVSRSQIKQGDKKTATSKKDDDALQWTSGDLAQSRPAASSGSSGSGGSVYVRGYTRKDGTYVHAHTRSSPRR